jgi:hypothetical protein
MRPSALALLLITAASPVMATAAPQLPPGPPTAAPAATTGSSSALELGVRVMRIALDGAGAAAQQMLALEQTLVDSATPGDDGAGPASAPVPGSGPSSLPNGTNLIGGNRRILRRSQRRSQLRVPVEQQIKAARVSFLHQRRSISYSDCFLYHIPSH